MAAQKGLSFLLDTKKIILLLGYQVNIYKSKRENMYHAGANYEKLTIKKIKTIKK